MGFLKKVLNKVGIKTGKPKEFLPRLIIEDQASEIITGIELAVQDILSGGQYKVFEFTVNGVPLEAIVRRRG